MNDGDHKAHTSARFGDYVDRLIEALGEVATSIRGRCEACRQSSTTLPEREGGSGQPRHPNRTRSLYRIIYAVAREDYDYDPTKRRQSTARRIEQTTELRGCRVDQDTINTVLKEAPPYLDLEDAE